MRVMVTGGAGYIGSVVTEELLRDGHEVVVYDNLQKGHRQAVVSPAVFVHADLADKAILAQTLSSHRIEAVIHMAADSLVGESCEHPAKYYQNNVVAGLDLLEAMRETGVGRIVFSSTAATYGEPEKQPIEETDPNRPTNPYGESKLAFERALRWYDEAYGLRYASLRYFNAAGASEKCGEDHDPESHIIPIALQVAAGTREVVQIYGDDYATPDGTCVRDYIHVIDLARAHILALGALDQGSRIYNLGCGGAGYSVNEVIAAAREVTGKEIRATVTARRPGDPSVLVASSEKIKRELGWKPQYQDLRVIIESAWKWLQAHPNGYDDWGSSEVVAYKKPATKAGTVKRSRQTDSPGISADEFLALKNPKGDLTLSLEGERVSVTSLDRVYWPDEKISKFELLSYYLKVSNHILPFLKNRPAILQRWPRGIKAPMFFQQDLESAPPFIKTVRLVNQQGRELDYAVYTTTASLLHFVNLGSIEQHPWHSTTAKLDKPDWLAIDLDPKKAPWSNVLQVALLCKQVCDEIGLNAFPKTSGSSGIHIYLPLNPTNEYAKVADFSRLLATEIANRAPKIATVERSIDKRKRDQVYVDWMQNARGKSLAAVFTARAKPGATVSMPLTWKQIEQGVKISDFTVKNVPALLKKSGDAWSNFFDQRQKLKLK